MSERQVREMLEEVRRLRGRVAALERQGGPGTRDVAWAGAVGMLQMFPGLVGLWPGGIRGANAATADRITDVSGHGLHLTRNGGCGISYSAATLLAPFYYFLGVDGYFSHLDAAIFDILGTEAGLGTGIKGLTLGGWFNFDNATIGTDEDLIGKRSTTGSGSSSYVLFRRSSDEKIVLFVSDGSYTGVGGETVAQAGSWQFCLGRYMPAAELAVWVGDAMNANTTSIPASLQNSAVDFAIGGAGNGANYLDGQAALCFICAAAVPDGMIEAFYQYSKGLFS